MTESRIPAPVRVAIVGAGFVADFYLRALASVRGHNVVALVARDHQKGLAVAQRYGVPTVVSSIRELLDQVEADLVIVALPHDLHVDAVRQVAEAGKAVIVTKPLGRNSIEAAACLAAVRHAGVWHGYAETEVFAPGLVRAKELVDTGAIGRVTSVRAREAHGSPHEHARDAERMGGGPLRGLGCHCVAIGRWFIGYETLPVEVFAWGDRLTRNDVSTEDIAIAIVRFHDGRVAQIEAGWNHHAGLDVRNEIQGTHGWISTNATGETGVRAFAGNSAGYVMEKATIDRGWINPVADEPFVYGYHGEMDHFIDAFSRGIEPRQTLLDGYIDNAVIDAAYRSMRTRAWATIDLSAM